MHNGIFPHIRNLWWMNNGINPCISNLWRLCGGGIWRVAAINGGSTRRNGWGFRIIEKLKKYVKDLCYAVS